MQVLMRALLLLLLTGPQFGLSAYEIDIHRLPIGDGNISSQPQRGSAWACSTRFGGGGAWRQGDWINDDGSYDFSAKPVVQGQVSWPSRFTVAVSGSWRVVRGNDLPSHPTGLFPITSDDPAYQYDRNPNRIRSQNFELHLPLQPVIAEQASCVGMGPIGFLLSGGVFFNALDARGKDAVAHEIQDGCQGHPERSGAYHYHSLTTCLEPIGQASEHSPLVGYALDGFGIYGRHGQEGRLLNNSDLNECHGHRHAVDWDGVETDIYHYHATLEYPYTVGCFKGRPQTLQGLKQGGGSRERPRPPSGQSQRPPPFGRPAP